MPVPGTLGSSDIGHCKKADFSQTLDLGSISDRVSEWCFQLETHNYKFKLNNHPIKAFLEQRKSPNHDVLISITDSMGIDFMIELRDGLI